MFQCLYFYKAVKVLLITSFNWGLTWVLTPKLFQKKGYLLWLLSFSQHLTAVPPLCTFSWHITIQPANIYVSHHRRKGTKEQKVGSKEFCYWWNGVIPSAPQLLSVSCNHLLLTTFKPSCTFSCTSAVFRLSSGCVGWRQTFLTGSFFFLNWWLVMPARQSVPCVFRWTKHLYISKVVLLVILLSLLWPKHTMPVKVTLAISLAVYEIFASANLFIRECFSSSLVSV